MSEQELTIGIAISVVFGFLRYRFPTMSNHLSEAGIAAGILLIIAELMVPEMKIHILAGGMFLAGMLLVGGSFDIWLKQSTANAQGVAMPSAGQTASSSTRDKLANALDDLATAIEASPPTVIGSQTVVTAGPGSSGTVIGKQVTVTAGPGSHGTIIGEQVVVGANGAPANGQKAQDVREAASVVRQGGGSKTSIGEVLAINPNLTAAMTKASQALQDSDLPL
jgi:hypothetical protein